LVGSVGRLADQIGYYYLIDAAANVIKEKPETYFVVIGDGPLAGDHKEQAISLGIQDRIIFTGGRTDVEELLFCLDLFALSSLWEGLPTVLLEAMAAGIPIVATYIPGTDDLIHHGEDGWLVPPYDAEGLGKGIVYLLDNPQLRGKLSDAAKETLKIYSIDQIAAQYERLYHQIYMG